MVVSIRKGRAEHIFNLCEQICPHEHGEDRCDESHLIHVSVWLSVSGPAGGLYKWASYYRGRIWRLIKFCDRGLKKKSPCYHLWIHCQFLQHNPCTLPPFPHLCLMKILGAFIALRGNCLSDLPSWIWSCVWLVGEWVGKIPAPPSVLPFFSASLWRSVDACVFVRIILPPHVPLCFCCHTSLTKKRCCAPLPNLHQIKF